jgi:hypothetical protein
MTTVLSFSVFVTAEVLKWANILPHKNNFYFLSVIVSHTHIRPVPSHSMYLAGFPVPILLQWPFSFPSCYHLLLLGITVVKILRFTIRILQFISIHIQYDASHKENKCKSWGEWGESRMYINLAIQSRFDLILQVNSNRKWK